VGVGATFDLTYGSPAPQRVILCNQQFAVLVYCQDVLDPNVMDDDFQKAWANVLGAAVCIPLSGDKKLAQMAVQETNVIIERTRTTDGNEDFTINDVTPDWLRTRGVAYVPPYSGPFSGFDWGNLWPVF